MRIKLAVGSAGQEWTQWRPDGLLTALNSDWGKVKRDDELKRWGTVAMYRPFAHFLERDEKTFLAKELSLFQTLSNRNFVSLSSFHFPHLLCLNAPLPITFAANVAQCVVAPKMNRLFCSLTTNLTVSILHLILIQKLTLSPVVWLKNKSYFRKHLKFFSILKESKFVIHCNRCILFLTHTRENLETQLTFSAI